LQVASKYHRRTCVNFETKSIPTVLTEASYILVFMKRSPTAISAQYHCSKQLTDICYYKQLECSTTEISI